MTMNQDQRAALNGIVTYLCDALTTTGEVGADQAADIINRLRVFDPAETGLVPQFRDTIASLAVTTPEPDPIAVEVTRAAGVVSLARAAGLADDAIAEVMYQVIEADTDPSDDLHRFIRDHFSGDDDFDEFRHEVDHELGHCSYDDEDCPWTDDDYSDGNAGLD